MDVWLCLINSEGSACVVFSGARPQFSGGSQSSVRSSGAQLTPGPPEYLVEANWQMLDFSLASFLVQNHNVSEAGQGSIGWKLDTCRVEPNM